MLKVKNGPQSLNSGKMISLAILKRFKHPGICENEHLQGLAEFDVSRKLAS